MTSSNLEGHGYKQKGKTEMPPQDWVPPTTEESWDDDSMSIYSNTFYL